MFVELIVGVCVCVRLAARGAPCSSARSPKKSPGDRRMISGPASSSRSMLTEPSGFRYQLTERRMGRFLSQTIHAEHTQQ